MHIVNIVYLPTDEKNVSQVFQNIDFWLYFKTTIDFYNPIWLSVINMTGLQVLSY